MTRPGPPGQTLDLGVIGNGSFGALVDATARVVWSCLPAFDGDPAFCALLSPREQEGGVFAIDLEDYSHSEQAYVPNTAVLRTILHDSHGGSIEILKNRIAEGVFGRSFPQRGQ